MKNLQEIEEAVSKLSESDLINFREWFEKFDQAVWDRQFEADVKSGKLDELAKKAISDFKTGKCKKI